MKDISRKIMFSIERPGQRTFIFFGLALVIIAFTFQGSRAIWQPDEGYYVGTAVTMYKTHSWIVPRLGKEIFLEKPPMLYWGIMAGIKMLGKSEFACRVFGAACYAVTVLVVGLIGYEIFGRKREGLLSAIIYATMVIPFTASNFITPDTPLTLWTTVSILFFWKSLYSEPARRNLFRMLMYTSLGLGFLTKGPAVMVPCGGMAVYLLVSGQFKKFFFTPWTLPGVLLFAIAGLSWYTAVAVKVPAAAAYFWDNQVWGRLVSHKYGRNAGIGKIYLYVPVLLFGALPWITVWTEKIKDFKSSVLKKQWWRELRSNRGKLFLITMFFVPLAILSAANSRLVLYALPLFAILAVAASRLWAEKLSALIKTSRPAAFIKPVLMTSVWVVLLVFSRFAMAHFYNCNQDARALWKEITPYLPDSDYEIVTLDKRADGLLFYGAKNVENVTGKDDPYPTFSMPKKLGSKISEIRADKRPCLFIIEGRKRLRKIMTLLNAANIKAKSVPLNYNRWLIETLPVQKK